MAMSDDEIVGLARAHANLYATARTRRRAAGRPADEYDDWLRVLARRDDRERQHGRA